MTGMPGCAAWTCAIRRCSASSAPSAAKWAICGLKAQTYCAVASTMSRQKLNVASGSFANCAGNFAGSGSSPTHTSELACFQRVRSACMKLIVDPRGSARMPSVRLSVLVEIAHLAINAPQGQVVVRILHLVFGMTAADFEIDDIRVAAIDQLMRVAAAGGEAGAHARLQFCLASVGHQRGHAFQHEHEFVLVRVRVAHGRTRTWRQPGKVDAERAQAEQVAEHALGAPGDF